MTLPATLDVSLNFSSGATFGNAFTLDDPINGVLGTGVLSDSTTPALVVNLTSQTRQIDIRRGRNILRTPMSVNWEEFKAEREEHKCLKCRTSKQAEVNTKMDLRKQSV